jgi:MFS family permease
MVIALLALIVGALAAALTSGLVWRTIAAGHPEARVFAEHQFYGQGLYLGGLYLLTLALLLAALPWLTGRLGRDNVTAAGVTGLVIVALIVSVVDPLASYLSLWPALVGALGLLGLAAMPARGAGAWMWARFAVPLVAAVPTLALPGAVVYETTIDGFGDSPATVFAIIVLLVGALATPIEQIARLARRALPVGVAAAGLGLLIVGDLTSGYSVAQPRPDTLLYTLNADAGQAYWVSPDPRLDEWTGQFLVDAAPRTTDELYGDGGAATLSASRAPVAPLPPPTLELIATEATGELVTLRARLISPRGADRVWIIPRDGAELLAAGLDGDPPAPIEAGALNIDGLPADGLELALRLRAAGPVRLTVLDASAGLPDIPGVTLPARPATVMAAPNPEDLRGYPTVVRTSVVFEPSK